VCASAPYAITAIAGAWLLPLEEIMTVCGIRLSICNSQIWDKSPILISILVYYENHGSAHPGDANLNLLKELNNAH